jgi:hypothetical protein
MEGTSMHGARGGAACFLPFAARAATHLPSSCWGCAQGPWNPAADPLSLLFISLAQMPAPDASPTASTASTPAAPLPPALPTAEEDKLARIAALVQHRCHPRAADVVHTLVNLRLGALPERASLLAACLASAPGSEPAVPYLLDPAAQGIRLRPRAAAAAAAAAAAPAPAAAAAAGGGAAGTASGSAAAAQKS